MPVVIHGDVEQLFCVIAHIAVKVGTRVVVSITIDIVAAVDMNNVVTGGEAPTPSPKCRLGLRGRDSS